MSESPKVIELSSVRGGKPPEPPTIRIEGGELHHIATAGERALITAGQPLYQRGRSIVRPVWSEAPASRGRTVLAASLASLSAPGLTDRLSRSARWEKYDGRAKKWLPCDPPDKIAATILSRFGEWLMPSIAGVVTTPTLRPDGSLLTEPGYDRTTRLYHVADATLNVGPFVGRTREAAEAALADLQYLLKGFPTVSETDVSVSLSAMVSPVVRGACPVVPLHAFRASTAGTGKTYLVDVASTIATGRPCPVASVAPGDEGETEKRLAGLLLAGFPVICLDNVNGELGGDLLAQAIERPLVQIRPLGASDIVEIESRSSIFATGNALRLRGDMTRRGLIANLDAAIERPELRQFDFDPVEMIVADRSRYVGACLTIVLSHLAADAPGEKMIQPLASFGEWSRLVRAALVWLGCGDPCASMEQAREDDPELIDLIELLDAWKAEFGTNDAPTASEIIQRIAERRYADDLAGTGEFKYPTMRELVYRFAAVKGVPDGRTLGNKFRAKAGKIVRGFRLVKASTTSGVIRWQVRKV